MSRLSVAPFIKEFYPEYYSLHEYPADKCAVFSKVGEPWDIFSNFGRTPLTVNGMTFENTEKLFQLMKFTDSKPLLEIFNSHGQTIKMKAKKKEYDVFRRPDWGSVILDVMKFCLMTKYEQSEEFRNELKRSEGLYIVEQCPDRKKKNGDTWSCGLNDGVYQGSNLMGRLLMELRDNGKLEYTLPADALDFIEVLKRELSK